MNDYKIWPTEGKLWVQLWRIRLRGLCSTIVCTHFTRIPALCESVGSGCIDLFRTWPTQSQFSKTSVVRRQVSWFLQILWEPLTVCCWSHHYISCISWMPLFVLSSLLLHSRSLLLRRDARSHTFFSNQIQLSDLFLFYFFATNYFWRQSIF